MSDTKLNQRGRAILRERGICEADIISGAWQNLLQGHDDFTPAPTPKTIIAPNHAGMFKNLPNEIYHRGPGISKSGLEIIANKCPAAYRFGEYKPTAATALGTATHTALLEPEKFEAEVIKGPDARGNSNIWKDAQAEANLSQQIMLKQADYEMVLRMRDSAFKNATIDRLIRSSSALIECSVYWDDPKTGELCRCRPDVWRRDLGLKIDVKTAVNASPNAFAKAAGNFGYHNQEAFYSEGCHRASGEQDNGMIFIVLEKEPPFIPAIYELSEQAVKEGRLVMRDALDTYAKCKKLDVWPGYADELTELDLQRWSYKLSNPYMEAAA